MSFGLYSIGFAIVIGGLIFAAYLLHMPTHWIAGGATVLLGVGILTGGKATRQKDPVAERDCRTGIGGPDCLLVSRPTQTFAPGRMLQRFAYRQAEDEGAARRALKASFTRLRMVRRFWAIVLAQAKRPI